MRIPNNKIIICIVVVSILTIPILIYKDWNETNNYRKEKENELREILKNANAKQSNDLNDIYTQVAMEEEEKYYIVERNGSTVDKYVQAGVVAAACLQAGSEVQYKKWKGIESKHAKSLGLK